MAVSDLDALLKDMSPELHEENYYFATLDKSNLIAISGYLQYVVDVFREEEGLSIVFEEPILEAVESLSREEIQGPFSMISLNINSDLMAVGFLARVTLELAREGISVNAFSAYHHDHLFVPHEKREESMLILERVSNGQK